MAVPLERAMRIGNTELGLLVTAGTLTGAVFTLPAGALVDRANRLRLLVGAVALWSVGMVVSGFAVSYSMLLVSRLSLGAVVAVAGPAIASLTGDLVDPGDRGRIYGYILLGELLGAGAGLLIAGNIAALASWRASFVALAVPGFALAWALHHFLAEPPRRHHGAAPSSEASEADDILATALADRGVRARPTSSREEVERATLARAVAYVLTIRTNVVLIVGSGLGYFFFSGVRTFGVGYLRGRFGLGQSAASSLVVVVGAGAVVGVLVTGRLADRLIAGGRIAARPVVAGFAFVVAAALFVPALFVSAVVAAVALMFVGAAAYGGSNAPLDAARLDVVPGPLWGRAEGTRTLLRTLFEASAPLLFGYVSTLLGGGQTSVSATKPAAAVAAHHGLPLAHTFLIMLAPMAIAGALLITLGRRTYPADVATALAIDRSPGGTSSGVPGMPTDADGDQPAPR